MGDKENVLIHNTCASCGSFVDLYEILCVDNEENMNYVEMFEKCFCLNLKESSWVDKHVCISCIYSLKSAIKIKSRLMFYLPHIKSDVDYPADLYQSTVQSEKLTNYQEFKRFKKNNIEHSEALQFEGNRNEMPLDSSLKTKSDNESKIKILESIQISKNGYMKIERTCSSTSESNGKKPFHTSSSDIAEEVQGVVDKRNRQPEVLQDGEDYKIEFLDEGILTEEERNSLVGRASPKSETDHSEDENSDRKEDDGDSMVQTLDDTICVYCEVQLSSEAEVRDHIRLKHHLDPKTGEALKNCPICDVDVKDFPDHMTRCHPNPDEEGRLYQCHFCPNVYKSLKSCLTHTRLKHGVKLYNDLPPAKVAQRPRVKCHLCDRDFSQKQILNKHLLKVHNVEVKKRKAFSCPLCSERVSYGNHFSAHLLHSHGVHQEVAELEFSSLDEFLKFKASMQDETKHRFRKVSASRIVLEGLRSNYMCSQSGVYVYQGKGKRPAPERQIYKTGKACPAHMIVTESAHKVHVTFHQTHVGHGPCPYYDAREPKKRKSVQPSLMTSMMMVDDEMISETDIKEEDDEMTGSLAWICDTCGMGFLQMEQFREHIASHNTKLCPCQYCDSVFDDIEAWTRHIGEHTTCDIVYTL